MDIKVPPMGESIKEATIGPILKPSGSSVEVDDELLELETDKVNQVLYAPIKGVLTLKVTQGQKVLIGDVIGNVAPAERKEEEVIKEPLLSAKKEVPPTPAPISPPEEKTLKRKKMSSIRKVIAERLVEVQRETAMLTTFNEVDLSQVMEARDKHREIFQKTHGVKLGFMSFFVQATCKALQKYPDVHAFIEGDDIVYPEGMNIGIAVSTDRGVVVPVVRGCESRSFASIEKEIESFALKAKKGGITPSDFEGGSFTITNGGVFGSLLSTPILNPPQSAILGMHKIQKRAVVVNDTIVIRPMMYLALSYDHRIIDGKEAVSFLVHIKNCLEDLVWMQLDL